jgi:hypothetical protein
MTAYPHEPGYKARDTSRSAAEGIAPAAKSIRARVFDALDAIHAETVIRWIIEGGAKGADESAAIWAIRRGVTSQRFSASWAERGPAAGPIRNQQMIDEGKPDLVLAFPGGRGTADMVRRAKAAGVEVREVPAPTNPGAA